MNYPAGTTINLSSVKLSEIDKRHKEITLKGSKPVARVKKHFRIKVTFMDILKTAYILFLILIGIISVIK